MQLSHAPRRTRQHPSEVGSAIDFGRQSATENVTNVTAPNSDQPRTGAIECVQAGAAKLHWRGRDNRSRLYRIHVASWLYVANASGASCSQLVQLCRPTSGSVSSTRRKDDRAMAEAMAQRLLRIGTGKKATSQTG